MAEGDRLRQEWEQEVRGLRERVEELEEESQDMRQAFQSQQESL